MSTISLFFFVVGLVTLDARFNRINGRNEVEFAVNQRDADPTTSDQEADTQIEANSLDWILLEHSANRPRLGVDPDIDRDTYELIVSNGYPGEEHNVITPDGFILKMHRIPHGKDDVAPKYRQPVYLQHGLLGSSADYVLSELNSLAFVLADAGFDVWLGNIRGNVYNRRHIHLSPDSDEFWDFSFDEHATIDLPSMVDYVLAATKQKKLYYIGYSQGTMMMFIQSSLQDTTFNDKIDLFIGMAPVTTINYMESPIKYLTRLTPVLDELFKLLGVREFIPSNFLTRFLAKYVCTTGPGRFLCDNVLFLLAGYDTSNFNQSRIPVFINHTPAGTSVKNIIHFGKDYVNKKFQFYDYGKEGNMKKYNSTTAPEIVLENCNLPTYLYHGEHDWMADPQDVQMAINRLPNVKHVRYLPSWNHLDFVWGETARKLIYNEIVGVLESAELRELI